MILGIDYGLKNIGIAISDHDEKIAVALKTFESRGLIEEILNLVKEKNITKIVMGYPIKSSGEEGYVAKIQNSLIEELKKQKTDLEVILIDESMTTQIAIESLKKQGYSYKSIQQKKDQESARVILQSYLDSQK